MYILESTKYGSRYSTMPKCLKYDFLPPATHGYTSSSRLQWVLIHTFKASPIVAFDAIFLFLFFFCLVSLLIGDYPSHICPCGWMGFILTPILPKAQPGEDMWQRQGQPSLSGDSDWSRDCHMIQARSDRCWLLSEQSGK